MKYSFRKLWTYITVDSGAVRCRDRTDSAFSLLSTYKPQELNIHEIMSETQEMINMEDSENFCSHKTVISIGFITFSLVNYLTKFIVPVIACQTPQQRWKWRNVATSFIHSFITGVWAPICFYQVKNQLRF